MKQCPYIGPRGGKWQDPDHTIPCDPDGGDASRFAKQDAEFPQTTQQMITQVGDELGEQLEVDTPQFKQGALDKIKGWMRSIGAFAKYQGKTEYRNNLNMFRYIGSVFSGGKIQMSPEERKASLAYMAYWAWSMVPAKAGGVAAAVKLGVASAAGAVGAPWLAVPLGAVIAYGIGSRLLYPALSYGMKKVMERGAGEKLDPDVSRYIEGYTNLISPEKRQQISFVKAVQDLNPQALEQMAPLMASIVQEAMREVVAMFKNGDLPHDLTEQIHATLTQGQEQGAPSPAIEKGKIMEDLELVKLDKLTPGFTTSVNKGAGHKYFKREPTGKPKPKYRYWYKVPGKGLVSSDGAKAGAKFRHGKEGEHGHYEVKEVHDDGTVTVHHDETGHKTRISQDELRDMIHGGDHHLDTKGKEKKGELNREDHQKKLSALEDEAEKLAYTEGSGLTDAQRDAARDIWRESTQKYNKLMQQVNELPLGEDYSFDVATGEEADLRRQMLQVRTDAVKKMKAVNSPKADKPDVVREGVGEKSERGKFHVGSDPEHVYNEIGKMSQESADKVGEGSQHHLLAHALMNQKSEELDSKLKPMMAEHNAKGGDPKEMPKEGLQLMADFANEMHDHLDHIEQHGVIKHPGEAKEGLSDDAAKNHLGQMMMHYTGNHNPHELDDSNPYKQAFDSVGEELTSLSSEDQEKLGHHGALNKIDDAMRGVKEGKSEAPKEPEAPETRHVEQEAAKFASKIEAHDKRRTTNLQGASAIVRDFEGSDDAHGNVMYRYATHLEKMAEHMAKEPEYGASRDEYMAYYKKAGDLAEAAHKDMKEYAAKVKEQEKKEAADYEHRNNVRSIRQLAQSGEGRRMDIIDRVARATVHDPEFKEEGRRLIRQFGEAKRAQRRAEKGMRYVTLVKGKPSKKKDVDLMPDKEDLSKPVPEGKEVEHYVHKWKHGEPLSTTKKPPVSREQAIAIGLSEARKGNGTSFKTRNADDPDGGGQTDAKPWDDPPGSGPGAQVNKGNGPPGQGWSGIPGGHANGYRKRSGNRWTYWYPSGAHARHDKQMHQKHMDKHKPEMDKADRKVQRLRGQSRKQYETAKQNSPGVWGDKSFDHFMENSGHGSDLQAAVKKRNDHQQQYEMAKDHHEGASQFLQSQGGQVNKALSLGQMREEGWRPEQIRAGNAGSPQGAAPNLSRIPINQRPAAKTTVWPAENRPTTPFIPTDSRNYGNGLFRRYPNGELDYGWAKSVVEEAIRKSKIGLPLTENEALSVSAVFPKFSFQGLPASIVAIKARLSATEAEKIRKTLSIGAKAVLDSMGVASGMA